MSPRLSAACAAALVGMTILAPAQASQKYVDAITKSVSEQCLPNVEKMAALPEIGAIAAQHPVEAAKVCDCAVAAFLADTKLHDVLMTDDKTLQPRTQVDPLKSYMNLRVTTSVYKCLVPELDSTLSGVSLDAK